MNGLLSKVPVLRRFYHIQSELERTLLLSCLFSIAMVVCRIAYTENLRYFTLIWNLFLAFIPYWISRSIYKRPSWTKSKAIFTIAFISWLLFLPNSFYIITDLFHLRKKAAIPIWFDLAMIFSFAWNGLLMGVVSLRQMEQIVEKKWNFSSGIIFICPIMFLNAFGIYLGRYLRFNSWDVVANPFSLVEEIVFLFVHPIHNRLDWGMIVCYSVLMTLIYLTLKRIGKEN